MITEISFVEIYDIWNQYLWPNRQSKIESNSAMVFLGGYNIANMHFKPTFTAYKDNNKIVGVNSGHKCIDNSYRSRGLYVLPEYRKKGIGVALLRQTIKNARNENCEFVWSYPKQSSWNTYSIAGFNLAGDWHQSELDTNAYCKLVF